MSTTITPTEQNIEINVNNDVIDINVTNEIVDVNATTQQIDINVAGAYPIPNPVLSVFGRTGVVVATEGDYTLTQLGDVTLTSPTNGQVLKYNGTTWVNGTDAGGLTSVGLSMPTAFTVTNSPLTSNGTISVTGAGTTAQYVRGDGTLATFPSIITQAQNLVTEVYNRTGATLTKGTIVYINGGQGNLPTVTKALATGDSTSAQTYGVVQTNITNMNNGYVVVAGRLSDLDTQAYTEGTQLYLSSTTAGTWTSTKQYAPNHLVYVGIVVRAHPTQGVVEIKIQNGYELDELHNVAAQTPTNNDGLFWESATNLWKNKSIATILGGTPVTGTGTTNYLAKFTGSSTIGIGQVLDDGTSVLIGTTSSTPNVKVGIYSTTQRTLEVVSTNSNALFVQSPAAFIATISNGTWVTNFTNTGRLDLAGDLLVNTIANATTDTDRFLVSDSGVIKYRTGAELLSDIGGQGIITNPITGTGTSGQVAYFNGTNSITSNAAFAFTPTSQLLVNNSVTAASAIARGTNLTPTLVAAANSDRLVGLDITPTFTNGAFSGVINYALRVNSQSLFIADGSSSATNPIIVNATNSGSFIGLANLTAPNLTATQNATISMGVASSARNQAQWIFNYAGSGLTSNYQAFGFNGVATPALTLFASGNTSLNSTTDAGFRLDVNGTARVQDNLTVSFGKYLYLNGDNTVYLRSPGANILTLGVTGGTNSLMQVESNKIIFGSSAGSKLEYATNTGLLALNSAPVAGRQFTINDDGGSILLNLSKRSSNGQNYLQAFNNTSSTVEAAITNGGGAFFLGDVGIGTSTFGTATKFTLGGSETASSAIARGQLLNTTLIAAANNDVLVGLDINPTFTNGAFTGVTNYGLRSQARVFINPTIATTNSLLRITDSTNGTCWMGFSSTVATGFFIGTNGSLTLGQGVSGDNAAPIGSQITIRATTGGRMVLNTNSANEGIQFSDGSNATIRMQFPSVGEAAITTLSSHNLSIGTSAGTTSAVTNTMKFFASTNNVGINQNTDSGFRLDVNGTARVQGTTTISGDNNLIFQRATDGNSLLGIELRGSGGAERGAFKINMSTGELRIGATTGGGFFPTFYTNGIEGGRFTTGGTFQTTASVTAASAIARGVNFNNTLVAAANNDVLVALDINPTFTAGAFTGTSRYVLRTNAPYVSLQNPQVRFSSATTASAFELVRFSGATESHKFQFITGYNGPQLELFAQSTSGGTYDVNVMSFFRNGNIVINSTADVASSILTIESTTKGFLPPRMTTTQKTAISSPATGLVVYDTTLNKLSVYTGAAWETVTSL